MPKILHVYLLKGTFPLDLIKFSPQRSTEINSRDIMKNLESLLPPHLPSPLPCQLFPAFTVEGKEQVNTQLYILALLNWVRGRVWGISHNCNTNQIFATPSYHPVNFSVSWESVSVFTLATKILVYKKCTFIF